MTRHSTFFVTAAWSLAGALLVGCTGSSPEAPDAPRVENHDLGLAIAAVYPPFVVAGNQGPVMELQTPGETGEGTLFIEATAELSGGINLVAEAEGMREWFEQQPEGQYFGNLELGTPLGPAFTSRGSYVLDGAAVEEIRVFTIHPTGNRMLRMTYRYPPGQGKERLQQLAEILGEIEGLAPTGQEASSEASGN